LVNNDLPGISASVLWEAGKAVMRQNNLFFIPYEKEREFKGITIMRG